MKRASLVLIALAAGLWAEPLSLPRIGAWRDAQARWRAVNGVAGTLLAGPVQWEGVRQGVSGGSRSLVRIAGELLVLEPGGTVLSWQAVGEGETSLLAVSAAGDVALAWLPERSELWIWRLEGWTRQALSLTEKVRALAVSSEQVRMLVERGGDWQLLTVSLKSGRVMEDQALPQLEECAAVNADGSVLWAGQTGLHRRNASGQVTDFEAPAQLVSLVPMGEDWWQGIDDAGGAWALRWRGEQVEWFGIPAGDGE